jgi:hypothetical protein
MADQAVVAAAIAILREAPRAGIRNGISLDATDENARNRLLTALQQGRDPSIPAALVALVRDRSLPAAARAHLVRSLDMSLIPADGRSVLAALRDDPATDAGTRFALALSLCGAHGFEWQVAPAAGTVAAADVAALRALYPGAPAGSAGRAAATILARDGGDEGRKLLVDELHGPEGPARTRAALGLAAGAADGEAIASALAIATKGRPEDRWPASQALQLALVDARVDDALKARIRSALGMR